MNPVKAFSILRDFSRVSAVVFFGILMLGVPFAWADEAALQQEIAQLRAQISQLQDELARASTGQSCGDSSLGEESRSQIELLRKIGQQQREHASVALGLAPGPLIIPDDILGAVLPDEYIILLNADDTPPQDAAEAAARIGVTADQITHVYQQALPGFAARLSEAERDRTDALPNVAGIVENGYVFSSGIGYHALHPSPVQQAVLAQQSIDTDPLPIDVYLFDTGIRQAHRDLRGRVAPTGFSFFDNGIAGEDCSGHGTHVAARIAGHTLGVSGSARLVSVKVIDRFGTGDVATVIAGIDWVMRQPGESKLVNMSLTRRVTQDPSALDMAVDRLIDDGAILVVAAGNASSDAADFTPARIPRAITVGSVNDMGLSDFSNAGETVDIYAPGEAILSASIRDVCGVHEMSGTSMAAPFVTGLIADLLASGQPASSLMTELRKQSTRVFTDAFEGETERYILNTSVLAKRSPCEQAD